jgi:hypothetical protein
VNVEDQLPLFNQIGKMSLTGGEIWRSLLLGVN